MKIDIYASFSRVENASYITVEIEKCTLCIYNT